jgi:hypothetical protein
MKLTTLTPIAAFAAATLLSFNILAAEADQAKTAPAAPATEASQPAQPSGPSMMGKGMPMHEMANADEAKSQPKKRSEPSRSKHYHPRDGK